MLVVIAAFAAKPTNRTVVAVVDTIGTIVAEEVEAVVVALAIEMTDEADTRTAEVDMKIEEVDTTVEAMIVAEVAVVVTRTVVAADQRRGVKVFYISSRES